MTNRLWAHVNNSYANLLHNLRFATSTAGTRGFTIVELLIVIIVIGILAAIIIVAYNGITNSARDNSANSAAKSLQKKAETLNASLGYYPGYSTGAAVTTAGTVTADFNSNDPNAKSANLAGSGLIISATALTPSTAASAYNTTLEYEICTTTGVSAYRIYWWLTSKAAYTATPLQGGNYTACTGSGVWSSPLS